MALRSTSLTVLTLGLSLISASPLRAQESAVRTVIRELTTTPGDRAVAGDRLASALAEWDRQIATLQAQVEPKAAGLTPERAFQLRVDLGVMYRRRGRLDEALGQFGAAVALKPGASDVQLLRALTLESTGQLDEASRAYQASLIADQTNPVKAYLVLRRSRGVEAAVETRAREVLRNAYARILAGEHRRQAQPFVTLDLIADASSPTPTTGEPPLDVVFARLAAGRLDEAAAALRSDVPAATPGGSARARIARGGVAEREGRLADARRDYLAAIDGTLTGRHALYVGIARLAQVVGDVDAAIDAFGHAVRLSPNEPALRRELAAALVAGGRFDEAFSEFVAALLISPDEPEVLAAIGQMFLDTDRAADAIAPLRRTLAVKADRYATHYALAVALSRAGRAEDAAREFELFERLSRQAMEERRGVVAGQPGPDESKR